MRVNPNGKICHGLTASETGQSAEWIRYMRGIPSPKNEDIRKCGKCAACLASKPCTNQGATSHITWLEPAPIELPLCERTNPFAELLSDDECWQLCLVDRGDNYWQTVATNCRVSKMRRRAVERRTAYDAADSADAAIVSLGHSGIIRKTDKATVYALRDRASRLRLSDTAVTLLHTCHSRSTVSRSAVIEPEVVGLDVTEPLWPRGNAIADPSGEIGGPSRGTAGRVIVFGSASSADSWHLAPRVSQVIRVESSRGQRLNSDAVELALSRQRGKIGHQLIGAPIPIGPPIPTYHDRTMAASERSLGRSRVTDKQRLARWTDGVTSLDDNRRLDDNDRHNVGLPSEATRDELVEALESLGIDATDVNRDVHNDRENDPTADLARLAVMMANLAST